MEIRSEYVELKVNDGTTMRAWTARPKGEGAHPGLLVFQEAFGVNAHIRDIAGRFAREGFVAVAPELFHRTGAGFDGRYDDFPSVVPHMKALNDSSMAADQRAAFDWLQGTIGPEPPISAIGYCMGGRAAFLAAITLPLAAAISYYGGGIAPNASNPGLLGPRQRNSGATAVVLGRARQAHSSGAGAGGERRLARRGKKLRECRDLERGPRIFLRCPAQLQSLSSTAGVASNAGVPSRKISLKSERDGRNTSWARTIARCLAIRA